MELIRTIREKQQTKKEADIRQQAEYAITVQDFDNELFIAFNGTPMSPIDPSWTTKEIIQQLDTFRNSYINYKLKTAGLPKVAAIF